MFKHQWCQLSLHLILLGVEADIEIEWQSRHFDCEIKFNFTAMSYFAFVILTQFNGCCSWITIMFQAKVLFQVLKTLDILQMLQKSVPIKFYFILSTLIRVVNRIFTTWSYSKVENSQSTFLCLTEGGCHCDRHTEPLAYVDPNQD